MNLSEIIGENIRVNAAIKQLHLRDLVNATGLSKTALIRIKKGDFKMIRINTLDALAQCLEVSVADLVTEKAFYKGGERNRTKSDDRK